MSRWSGLIPRWRVTPFVILFLERDGSTYLTSLLDSHPDIKAAYEHFAVMKQEGRSADEQLAWARSYLNPPCLGRVKAIGFKTKLVDVPDPADFSELLRSRKCHILRMARMNHVKAVISRINAQRLFAVTGKWNLYREECRLPPFTVNPLEFDQLLRERHRAESELEAFVASLRLPTLRLAYEDLLRDRDSVLRDVLSFLQVRPLALEGRTIKATSDDLRLAITNFDALREPYLGTRFGPMFDETIDPAR